MVCLPEVNKVVKIGHFLRSKIEPEKLNDHCTDHMNLKIFSTLLYYFNITIDGFKKKIALNFIILNHLKRKFD